MLRRRFGMRGILVQLERDGALRDAEIDGVMSNGVACVHAARWVDGGEVDLTDLEETYCEAELERAAAASIARDAMLLAERVPARRCA